MIFSFVKVVLIFFSLSKCIVRIGIDFFFFFLLCFLNDYISLAPFLKHWHNDMHHLLLINFFVIKRQNTYLS